MMILYVSLESELKPNECVRVFFEKQWHRVVASTPKRNAIRIHSSPTDDAVAHVATRWR